MSTRAVYRASPLLEERSIRLLTITDSTPHFVCSLQTHLLREAPSFTALSYTWGDSFAPSAPDSPRNSNALNEDLFVTLGDTQLPIQENLAWALSSLTSQGLKGPLWIDAICIDQNNPAERSSQVMLMGDIYAGANEVIVWLGPESAADSGALRLHNEFMPALRAYLGDRVKDTSAMRSLSLDRLLQLGILIDPKLFEAYSPFRRRSWFGRAWTFQEALLATNLRYLYGETFIERQDLDDLAVYDLCSHPSVMALVKERYSTPYTSLRTLQMLRNVFDLDPDIKHKPATLRDQLIVRDTLVRPHSLWESLPITSQIPGILNASTIRSEYLLSFVSIMRYRQTTDLRDKVYAVVDAINGLIPSRCKADHFFVSYEDNMTTEKVYFEFACWILRRVPQMTILSLVEDRSERRLKGLPSWVPDLSVTPEIHELISQRPTLEDSEGPIAALLLSTRSISSNKLSALGAVMDEIEAIDSVAITDVFSNQSYSLQSLLEFAVTMPHQYFNGEHRVEALWRTLIANKDLSSHARLSGQSGRVADTDMALPFRSYILEKLCRIVWRISALQEGSQQLDTAVLPTIDSFLAEHSHLLESLAEASTIDSSATADKIPIPLVSDIVTRLTIITQQNFAPHDGHVAEANASTTSLDSAEHDPYRYIQSLQTQGRRLYRTKRGFIGLAPRSAQVGDRICCLQAARVPFVLRPLPPRKDHVGFEFELVGEAYLHGMMDKVERAVENNADFAWETLVLV
ncbi:MAG: hypothetical protein HETSPECPRED_001456 [Heterodermia speciosa]|uniref:Heterokaryon incompatibility domain-containing protein n=1 Tax=Heterodermia speciosa TaxID=116794 RepID=A0A8H3PER1_9LECA|nr:MAG: hypothetical protein HETSPECPRED_001456 [Heterodermia speciosa]